MAFTLTGLLRDSAGKLRSGWLDVTCTADAVVDADNNELWSGTGRAPLVAGALSLELPAPGEGILPEAFGFTVRNPATGEVWNVTPTEGDTGDLTDFTSTTPVESPETLEVRVDGIETRVETLEEDGVGGGAVDSVNGEVGVVVLSAADVGADATGTASGLLAAHVAASDPHPGYLTPDRGQRGLRRHRRSVGGSGSRHRCCCHGRHDEGQRRPDCGDLSRRNRRHHQGRYRDHPGHRC